MRSPPCLHLVAYITINAAFKQWKAGYLFALVLMALSSLAFRRYFKRKKYLWQRPPAGLTMAPLAGRAMRGTLKRHASVRVYPPV
jgi:hypothetical protein